MKDKKSLIDERTPWERDFKYEENKNFTEVQRLFTAYQKRDGNSFRPSKQLRKQIMGGPMQVNLTLHKFYVFLSEPLDGIKE